MKTKTNNKPISMFYKGVYPDIFMPIRLVSAITAPLFWYEKWCNVINSAFVKKDNVKEKQADDVQTVTPGVEFEKGNEN